MLQPLAKPLELSGFKEMNIETKKKKYEFTVAAMWFIAVPVVWYHAHLQYSLHRQNTLDEL